MRAIGLTIDQLGILKKALGRYLTDLMDQYEAAPQSQETLREKLKREIEDTYALLKLMGPEFNPKRQRH